MNKRVGILSLLALFICGLALAQDPSAKFAASWSDKIIVAKTDAQSCATTDTSDGLVTDEDANSGVLLATMKMPSGKEILAGISAESSILLETRVSGKKGGSGDALAMGRVAVRVKAVNVDTGEVFFPVPGKRIVLNARTQELDATLGGVLDSCTDVNGDGTIDPATECTFTDEEIGLLTKSTSANHFNVVFMNLPQGTYRLRANFKLLSVSTANATVDVEALEGADACAYARSKVVLGNRIVTLQDVRAVNDGVIDMNN